MHIDNRDFHKDLKTRLQKMFDSLRDKRRNFIFVVQGEVGHGMSSSALHMSKMFDKEVKKAKSGDFILWDEPQGIIKNLGGKQ